MSPEKGGGLRAKSTSGRQVLVGGLLCGALLGVPLSLLGSGAATKVVAFDGASGSRAAAAVAARPNARAIPPSELAHFVGPVQTTTTTTTTTTAPATTTTVPVATTTTQPPPQPTSTSAPASPPGNTATGLAQVPDGASAYQVASPVAVLPGGEAGAEVDVG